MLNIRNEKNRIIGKRRNEIKSIFIWELLHACGTIQFLIENEQLSITITQYLQYNRIAIGVFYFVFIVCFSVFLFIPFSFSFRFWRAFVWLRAIPCRIFKWNNTMVGMEKKRDGMREAERHNSNTRFVFYLSLFFSFRSLFRFVVPTVNRHNTFEHDFSFVVVKCARMHHTIPN